MARGSGWMKRLSGLTSEGAPEWMSLNFGGDAARTGGGDRGLSSCSAASSGVLIGDEAGADFGHGARGDHGLGAFAGEAAADAVDFESGARPQALEQRNAGLADQFARAHLLLGVLLLIERQAAQASRSLSLGGTTRS